MRAIRAALSYLAFLLALPFLLLHPKLRDGLRERLGLHPPGWPGLPVGPPRIWIHGASAGDVLALLPFVRELKARRPDVLVVGSTMTNSGRAILERERAQFAAITFVPYDLPGAVRRTLSRIKPKVLVLEYTELWPQLVTRAAARGIAVVLHNGRFAPENVRRYRRLFRVTGNLLRSLRLLLLRDESEAERALVLGAAPEHIMVTGNTKFDSLLRPPEPAKVEELRRALALGPEDRLWVAGSTHDGEEESLLETYRALRAAVPALRMVIAPRYVERAPKVRAAAERRGLATRMRSEPGGATAVVVLDTIGELAACYQLAEVVFVGGSFVSRGGQNILEPAACGRPVIFGPSMRNFADAVQVLLGRGGMQVATPAALEKLLGELLASPTQSRELGELARAQVIRVGGAAAKNAAHVAALLEGP